MGWWRQTSGGTLTTSGTAFVGYGGNGTVNQTGGTFSAGNLYVGGSSVAASGGTGMFSILGGSTSISGAMKIWNTPGTLVTLSGGTLPPAGTLDVSGNPARFNWTSGTLSLTNTDTLNIDSSGPLGTSLDSICRAENRSSRPAT